MNSIRPNSNLGCVTLLRDCLTVRYRMPARSEDGDIEAGGILFGIEHTDTLRRAANWGRAERNYDTWYGRITRWIAVHHPLDRRSSPAI